MLLCSVLCFAVFCGATQQFDHIKRVNVDSLPVVHQRDLWTFVETYLEGTAKRSYVEDHPSGFFQLKSVLSMTDKKENHFVIKPVYFAPEVWSDGKRVDSSIEHTFNGYQVGDDRTIIVLQFPRSGEVDGHPLAAVSGMVHHSDGKCIDYVQYSLTGSHYTIGHSAVHGLFMQTLNVSSVPKGGCKGAKEHDHHHHHGSQHEDFVFKRSYEEEFLSKRNVEAGCFPDFSPVSTDPTPQTVGPFSNLFFYVLVDKD